MAKTAEEAKMRLKNKAEGKIDYDILVTFDLTSNMQAIENILMRARSLELTTLTEIQKPE